MGDKEYAEMALVLENELQKERARRQLAEQTIESLTEQLLKAAEEIRRLKGT